MINPSEISEILKQQLENVNSKVAFEETGTVLEVGDGVAHVYGLSTTCAPTSLWSLKTALRAWLSTLRRAT